MIKILLILLLTVELKQHVGCAKILGVFPFAGKSINILYNKLMRGLADAGHDVTVISAFENKEPIKNGTITDVLLTGLAEKYERMLDEGDFYQPIEQYPIWKVHDLNQLSALLMNDIFNHPNLIKFLKEKHTFDVVIEEYFWSESLLGFAKIYNCPMIIFTSLGGVNVWVNEMAGNPLLPSYVPHSLKLGDYSNGMSFFNRLHNLFYYVFDAFHKYFISFPVHTKILKQVLSNAPDIAEIYYNSSLVLLGSHSSMHQAIPFAPNMVEIGGFHIDPPKKLPKDLQDFLDNAKNGAVYFSMGSHLKSKYITKEKKTILLKVFKQLKVKILWKFEDQVLPGKPENVLTRRWLPQMDVLAHPNIKLFITHGGFCSTLETIYHGVPALMIPVFADQFTNAIDAERAGYALKLPYGDKNFTEETLSIMMNELLKNQKYTEAAKRLSRLFHDRPMKPLETAVYWIEYVIRHKGADHLKVAGLKLPWYKYYMVDVLLFLISILIFIVYVSFYFVKSIFPKGVERIKIKTN